MVDHCRVPVVECPGEVLKAEQRLCRNILAAEAAISVSLVRQVEERVGAVIVLAVIAVISHLAERACSIITGLGAGSLESADSFLERFTVAHDGGFLLRGNGVDGGRGRTASVQ